MIIIIKVKCNINLYDGITINFYYALYKTCFFYHAYSDTFEEKRNRKKTSSERKCTNI